MTFRPILSLSEVRIVDDITAGNRLATSMYIVHLNGEKNML